MPISEWSVPFTLISPQGSLFFNNRDQVEGYYLLDKGGCDSGSEVRATVSLVPQGDGAILHRGFTAGYVVKFLLEYWAGFEKPACFPHTPIAREMDDLLMRHLRSILNGGGRILYTPTGAAVRLIDDVRMLDKPVVAEQDGFTSVTFTLGSPFPYTIDFTQTLTQLDAGDPSATLDNTGTAPFYPVFKVYGPTDNFTIENETTDLRIVYDSDLPGAVEISGGTYVEIDTFRNTIYLNGDGPSRKAGIDIERSDFFPLEVGENIITASEQGSFPSPDVDILWQPAWF